LPKGAPNRAKALASTSAGFVFSGVVSWLTTAMSADGLAPGLLGRRTSGAKGRRARGCAWRHVLKCEASPTSSAYIEPTADTSSSRMRSASRRGGCPKSRAYSLLNCEALA
jgi:hypothetical protein